MGQRDLHFKKSQTTEQRQIMYGIAAYYGKAEPFQAPAELDNTQRETPGRKLESQQDQPGTVS